MKIPKLTKLEKIYVSLFAGSILLGFGYGFIDTDYFKCCEDLIGVPPEGTSPMEIFRNNFLISLSELITLGASSLFVNFQTFSILSSYLYTNQGLLALPIIMFIAVFELIGGLFFGLTGISFVEKKFFKVKTKLNSGTLFFLGTALIFLGAIVEYFLISLGN